MTTEELAELFLMSLYDMAEAAPHPYFLFTMNEFVAKMGISDMAELRKALNVLEDKSLIYLASTDAWGGVSAGITIDGSSFVEKGGETGIIERYRIDPSSIGIVPRTESTPLPAQETSVSAGSPEFLFQPSVADPSRDMLDAILAEMATAVRTEIAAEPSARSDLLDDIETLRIQLSRRTRNQAVIKALLDNLSAFPYLAPLARLVLRLI
jgi:hypothetical protein